MGKPTYITVLNTINCYNPVSLDSRDLYPYSVKTLPCSKAMLFPFMVPSHESHPKTPSVNAPGCLQPDGNFLGETWLTDQTFHTMVRSAWKHHPTAASLQISPFSPTGDFYWRRIFPASVRQLSACHFAWLMLCPRKMSQKQKSGLARVIWRKE